MQLPTSPAARRLAPSFWMSRARNPPSAPDKDLPRVELTDARRSRRAWQRWLVSLALVASASASAQQIATEVQSFSLERLRISTNRRGLIRRRVRRGLAPPRVGCRALARVREEPAGVEPGLGRSRLVRAGLGPGGRQPLRLARPLRLPRGGAGAARGPVRIARQRHPGRARAGHHARGSCRPRGWETCARW